MVDGGRTWCTHEYNSIDQRDDSDLRLVADRRHRLPPPCLFVMGW
jgi:hypothetical protein